MIHLTLNTGHARISPRAEVGADILRALRPLVQAGGGPLPTPPGYTCSITREGRNAAYTISRGIVPLAWALLEDALHVH